MVSFNFNLFNDVNEVMRFYFFILNEGGESIMQHKMLATLSA